MGSRRTFITSVRVHRFPHRVDDVVASMIRDSFHARFLLPAEQLKFFSNLNVGKCSNERFAERSRRFLKTRFVMVASEFRLTQCASKFPSTPAVSVTMVREHSASGGFARMVRQEELSARLRSTTNNDR